MQNWHNDFQEVFGRGVRQLPHTEIVDDEERHSRKLREVSLPRAIERRVGDLLDQGVLLTIEDAIALLDHRATDGLGQMAFPRPWWPEKERVLALRDEPAGCELVNQRAIHFLVEIEIEGVERAS